MKYTKEQFEKVGHTLGINVYNARLSKSKKDKILPAKFYRNYYNYGRIDGGNEVHLWIIELNNYINTWEQHGLYYFQINEDGIKLFREQFYNEITSKHVPLSKSKQRYQDYLDADTGQSYDEYLGIIKPSIEYFKYISFHFEPNLNQYSEKDRMKLRRYLSNKYEVTGAWKLTSKEAKESYKKNLKIHKKYLKELE